MAPDDDFFLLHYYFVLFSLREPSPDSLNLISNSAEAGKFRAGRTVPFSL